MVIFASEDIGLAMPTALVVANAVFRAVETIGLPEAGINLAHGVAYLSNCAKDKSAYEAYKEALQDAKKYGKFICSDEPAQRTDAPYEKKSATAKAMRIHE